MTTPFTHNNVFFTANLQYKFLRGNLPDTLFRKGKSLLVDVSILLVLSLFSLAKVSKIIMLAEYDVAGLDYVDSDVGTMSRNPVTVIDIVGKHYAKLP